MSIAEIASQSAAAGSNESTGLTLTFNATATLGNLLVCGVAWVNNTDHSNSTTVSISGWTEAVQQGRSGTGSNRMNGVAILFKISDGTETDVTIELTNGRKHVVQFAEFSGIDGTPLDNINSFDQASLVNSIQPGTTGTLSQAEELVIAVAGWGDDGWTSPSWDSGFVEASAFQQQGGSGTDVSLGMGFLIVSATTALNPTHSVTGTAEDAIACIATFKAPAAGGDTTMVAVQGSYSLTGQDATTTKDTPLTAAQGSYALTGKAANLLHNRLLAAAQGSYALTGQDAITAKTVLLAAAQGGYTLTGQASILRWDRVLAAVQGSYALNGQAAVLSRQVAIAATQGGYALTGQAATLRWAHEVLAAQGNYALTGQAAVLSRQVAMVAAQGSYALTGQAALFLLSQRLAAAQGSYALNGQDAVLFVTLVVVTSTPASLVLGDAAVASAALTDVVVVEVVLDEAVVAALAKGEAAVATAVLTDSGLATLILTDEGG